MESVLDAIHAAVASDATPQARAAGIAACQTLLAALGSKPGEPLSAPTIPQVGATATAIASIVRSAPPDQLFDLLITKLRSMVPPDTQPSDVRRMTIPYVKVPRP